MRYCSIWLRSLLCYIKNFVIEEFVIRVLHCTCFYSTGCAKLLYYTYVNIVCPGVSYCWSFNVVTNQDTLILHNTVEHSYNKPEILGQSVCYKQEFVI